MGRRRRRVIKVVKKKLPSVFTCPQCSEESVRVTMPRGNGLATVQCASCGLKDQFEAPSPIQVVDVYCKFTDKYYGKGETAKPTTETKLKPLESPKTTTESEDVGSVSKDDDADPDSGSDALSARASDEQNDDSIAPEASSEGG